MRHPEVLLVPVLMLLDYYLTLVGSLMYRKSYGKHIHFETYELNPLWQQAVARTQWFNVRHILMAVLVTGLLLFCFEIGSALSGALEEFVLGVILVGLLLVVGRHVANILIFRYAARHPEHFRGEVFVSHEHVLKMSQYQLLTVWFVLLAVACFAPSPFAWGGVAAVLAAFGVHIRWLRKYRKQKAKRQADEEHEADATTPEGDPGEKGTDES
ncbi:MAG: hypothetical protein AB1696_25335 [Planctomycetota bacterium]